MYNNVRIVQAAATLAELPSLFFSCGTVPDTLSYAPPAAASFVPAVLACICIFQVPTATSRLRTFPALVLSLLAVWLAFTAWDHSLLAGHSRPSLMVSAAGTTQSLQTAAEVQLANSDAFHMAQTYKIGWTTFQYGTAADALQLRDAAAQFSQAQDVVASSWSSWLKTCISVAAAAAIVLCLLLLKGPGGTAGAVSHPSYRRQLHLSMLLCASIVLLMRPAAAATSAATLCSAITPVCFKASSSSAPTSAALPALDSRPKTPAAPRPSSTPVTKQRPSVQAIDVPPPPSTTTQDAPASGRPAALAWPAPVPVQPPAASSGYDALLAAMGARKETLLLPTTGQGEQDSQQLLWQQSQGQRQKLPHQPGQPSAARRAASAAAAAAPGDEDVPQRVLPTTNLPPVTAEMQAQLLDQLLATLLAPQPQKRPPSPSPPAAPTPAQPLVEPPPSPPPSPRPAVPPAASLLFLNSSQLRVAVDTRRGGAISHLSSPLLPGPWTNTNLINTWDSGRLVQQSYYGCPDGSCWSDRPWRFNPVQGGSWQNLSPKLLSVDAQGSSITTTSIPRNWGGQQLVEDAVMTSSVSLLDNNLVKVDEGCEPSLPPREPGDVRLLQVTFNMRYTGTATHPAHHQELPAVFVSRRLNVLALYTGSAPWTDQPVSFQLPGQLGQYYKLPERWAAYIDAATGFGIGVYNPYATDLVAYRIGPDNSSAKSDCSYFAPLVTAAIQPDTDFTYDVYITVGRLDDMRKRFKAIAVTVQPNLALQRRIPLEVDGLLQGSPIQASFVQHDVTADADSQMQEEQAQYSSAQAGGDDPHNRQAAQDTDKDFEQGDNFLFQDPDQQILSAAEGSSHEANWWSSTAMPTAAIKHLLAYMASVLSAAVQLSKEMLQANVDADPALSTD